MGLLDKIRSLDILSTPTAPKRGSVPLPKIEPEIFPLDLDVARGDCESTGSDCTPSPVTPFTRRRMDSFQSRSSTPRNDFYPVIPPPPPELIAPTPRRNAALALRDWGNLSPEPEMPKKRNRTYSMQHGTRPSSVRPFERSMSPEDLKPKSRYMAPQPPSRASTSRDWERSESPEKLKRPLSTSPKSPLRPSSSRPSTTTLCDDEPQTPFSETPTTRSASRSTRRSSASSTKRPLKGILKSTKPTPIDNTALRELEAEERADSPSPSSSPIPLPLDEFGLHWQLLPRNPSLGRHLRFDVALPVGEIRKYKDGIPLALGELDFSKAAVHGIDLTRMIIQCPQLSFWPPIVIKQRPRVNCGHVLEAIHEFLNTSLTDAEEERYVTSRRRAAVEEAFAKRCRDAPGLNDYVRRQGLRRIDLLRGKRIFGGLQFVDGNRCDLYEMTMV